MALMTLMSPTQLFSRFTGPLLLQMSMFTTLRVRLGRGIVEIEISTNLGLAKSRFCKSSFLFLGFHLNRLFHLEDEWEDTFLCVSLKL
jgi:hypothetical protein